MDKYLDYPKDKPIHHNGLPVKFITGSNIHAYGDWDLIIERNNCSANYSYLGFSVNSASPATKTMLATDVINHSLLVGYPTKTVSSKLVSGTHASLTATQRIATERSGTFLAYYYDEAYPVMGLKWANGVPANGSANAPDITNHGNKDGYSIIHKLYTTGTSLYKSLNASNYTEIHNVYAPNVTDATDFITMRDDYYFNLSGLQLADNIYMPKASLTLPAKTVKNVTARDLICSYPGQDSYVTNCSASTMTINTSGTFDNVSAGNFNIYRCSGDKIECGNLTLRNSAFINVADVASNNANVAITSGASAGIINASALTGTLSVTASDATVNELNVAGKRIDITLNSAANVGMLTFTDASNLEELNYGSSVLSPFHFNSIKISANEHNGLNEVFIGKDYKHFSGKSAEFYGDFNIDNLRIINYCNYISHIDLTNVNFIGGPKSGVSLSNDSYFKRYVTMPLSAKDKFPNLHFNSPNYGILEWK